VGSITFAVAAIRSGEVVIAPVGAVTVARESLNGAFPHEQASDRRNRQHLENVSSRDRVRQTAGQVIEALVFHRYSPAQK
jgi:hypothetical protein